MSTESKKNTIEDIINEVLNFDYNTSIGKNISISNKVSKLEKIVSKINSKTINNEKEQKDSIKELLEVLQKKLGSDFYLFSVGFITSFLREQNSINDLVKILFNNIQDEIKTELDKVLSGTDYSLASNIFNGDEEKNIQELINVIYKSDIDNSQRNLANLYVYILLKYRTRKDFNKITYTIEYVFVEYFSSFVEKEKSDYVLNDFPNALLDKNPKNKIKSFAHLFLKSDITELTKNLNSVRQNLNESRDENSNLRSDLNALELEINEKILLVSSLREQIKSKNEMITSLEQKLQLETNRLEFEGNMYDNQIQDLRTAIVTGLQNDLALELNSLNDFSNGLQQNDSEILRMFIDNINQKLNNL